MTKRTKKDTRADVLVPDITLLLIRLSFTTSRVIKRSHLYGPGGHFPIATNRRNKFKQTRTIQFLQLFKAALPSQKSTRKITTGMTQRSNPLGLDENLPGEEGPSGPTSTTPEMGSPALDSAANNHASSDNIYGPEDEYLIFGSSPIEITDDPSQAESSQHPPPPVGFEALRKDPKYFAYRQIPPITRGLTMLRPLEEYLEKLKPRDQTNIARYFRELDRETAEMLHGPLQPRDFIYSYDFVDEDSTPAIARSISKLFDLNTQAINRILQTIQLDRVDLCLHSPHSRHRPEAVDWLLDSLGLHPVSSLLSEDPDPNRIEKCSICLKEYDPEIPVIVLLCHPEHHFHTDCIRRALNKVARCPCCHVDVLMPRD
ncbi:hypothetical protein PGT21_011793 [Puccinia graminis f. sp. tritici]|uniref:RING-type E3 ubiquitin transferase n=1 Tax=Puccinia graminis f. sp. tritici TaxID=56615 RepID=A0A5B0LRY8_PUCGR|nr:hypothetical protein PGTUg99_026480 [Puccinia graminis f. sp. tritici]KAA1071565.1 hypothetical protein PGT21_011793 [Puccinia graminis f. sp. tritici]